MMRELGKVLFAHFTAAIYKKSFVDNISIA